MCELNVEKANLLVKSQDLACFSSVGFVAENDVFSPEANQPLPIDAWESLVLDVASGRLTREETTNRFRKLVKT